jgi:exodeoxyribonuclease-1
VDITSFYWYDYETFGSNPKRSRPAQFAGIRTDAELNPISEPLVLYCRPSPDFLPEPRACLMTGITPQIALERGVIEAEFISRIETEFSIPGTCVVGYNNIRFDDEITRYCLYRNLRDPYAREWKFGNSRWDLIDVMRMSFALRPEGIRWPRDKSGKTSFRLDQITVTNGVKHEAAHDALADVVATIELAKLVKNSQPRLYDFMLGLRDKRKVIALLGQQGMQPILHVSSRYPVEKSCLAVVAAVAKHPVNPNAYVTYDLSVDPEPLLTLAVEDLQKLLFTRTKDLAGDAVRLPLKSIHVNKCPALAPLTVLREEDRNRLEIDLAQCKKNLNLLRGYPALAEKIQAIVGTQYVGEETDPDFMLYEGFINDRDRNILNRIVSMRYDGLSSLNPSFEDKRLPELFFRYRARNYPETLDYSENIRWAAYRRSRLTEKTVNGDLTLIEYMTELQDHNLAVDLTDDQRRILADLREYVDVVAHGDWLTTS